MRPAALRHAHCRRALGVRRHRLLRPGRLFGRGDRRSAGAKPLPSQLVHPLQRSKSLEQLGFGYRDLIHVIEGHDRYAAEILRYRFDVRELEERKEDAVCSTV